jgi:shikimate dehydrogenase
VRRADCTISAHNTDAPALAAELGRLAGDRFSWGTGRALVLGSGGAARAAVAALGLHLGVRDVAVRARAFADPARLAAFVEAAPCPVAAQPWAADPSSERLTVALVQATTAGMSGGGDGDLAAGAVAWTALPPEAIALEVIYAPRETPWLRAARARGLRSDDGLGMLARQGALALELWLGIDAPLTAMRSALE